MSRAVGRWLEAFGDGLTVTLDRIIGTDDPVVAILRARGIAKHTGIEIDAVYACLCGFQGGKLIHMQTFLDPRDALEVAGLPAQDAHADS